MAFQGVIVVMQGTPLLSHCCAMPGPMVAWPSIRSMPSLLINSAAKFDWRSGLL